MGAAAGFWPTTEFIGSRDKPGNDGENIEKRSDWFSA
jgi:hypothetical protein